MGNTGCKENILFALIMPSIKNIHRIAGLSLCSAVGLGAIGQHQVRHQADETQLLSYQTANRYHYYPSFGLFTAQFTKIPSVTAGFFVLGMVLFCGTGYAQGLNVIDVEHRLKYSMPFGGT